MTIKEILKTRTKDNYLLLPEEFYSTASVENAQAIVDKISSELIRLPEQEIAFFEWLKTQDIDIWNDLWTRDELNEPYIVSIIFLPLLVYSARRGFPICDLTENDNYFFTPIQLMGDVAKVYLETADIALEKRKPISSIQLLVKDISMNQTDIWHFAYKYNIPIVEAKKDVERLVDEQALLHLKEADQLSNFFDF